MLKIRRNVFETNSSSTHTIAIPNNLSPAIEETLEKGSFYIHFHTGEFGWEFDEVNPADYLYTAIYEYYTPDEREEKLNYIKDALNQAHIQYEFEDPDIDSNGELKWAYIDHSGELGEFLDAIFNDSSKLVRFLINGEVFTGNDNSDCDWEETDAGQFVNDHSNDYEIYFKGN